MAAVAHQIDSSPSAHFAKISDEFGIDGSVTDDGLNHLVANYKSVLYLCTDDVAIGDCGYRLDIGAICCPLLSESFHSTLL